VTSRFTWERPANDWLIGPREAERFLARWTLQPPIVPLLAKETSASWEMDRRRAMTNTLYRGDNLDILREALSYRHPKGVAPY
jgi:hypothetical protein